MATVKENLIAARALIDTQEKFRAMDRSTLNAISLVTGAGSEANHACVKAMQRVSVAGGTNWESHTQVMAHFARAIAALEPSNG